MKLWGLHGKRTTLPAAQDIADALARVGLSKVEFDDTERTVRFSNAQMYLDFGGIAKGYALESAAATARRCGVSSGLIDLGGNILCLENPPPGRSAYSIGIRNPFDPASLLGTIEVTDAAVATSGNYERYVEIEGRIIHHIVDPATGRPVPDVAGVTVMTPRGIDSDVFSTAVFVRGEDLIARLLQSRERTGVLHVSLDAAGEPVIREYGWRWQSRDSVLTQGTVPAGRE